jgi:hypothetical protein
MRILLLVIALTSPGTAAAGSADLTGGAQGTPAGQHPGGPASSTPDNDLQAPANDLPETAPLPSSPARLLYQLRWWALGAAVLLVALWGRQQRSWQARAATVALLVVALSFIFGRSP